MDDMTFARVRKSIENKPVKAARYDKFNKTKKRKHGKNVHRCRKCGKRAGVIRKYGLLYCRQCFREQAEKLGFNKFD
jgi:ribosomal protein S14